MRGTLLRGLSVALATAATFAFSGCVESTILPNSEPASVAKRLGVPGCQLSVPMSQSEVVLSAKRDGDPHPEARDDWARIVATYQHGDELRKVSCLTRGRYGAAGDIYFGLFRGGAIIAKLNYIIVN